MPSHETNAIDQAGGEARPIVVISQCLGFAAVRYNGQVLEDSFVSALTQHVRVVQVCPEVAIGLGVPRDPIRIVVDKQGRRLVQPTSGRDLTEPMERFSADFLGQVGPVDGFILKSRSPSCGIKDVKTFDAGSGQPARKGVGLFAEAVQRQFPAAAIEDEGRLTNFKLRQHFLTRLFASARFRDVQARAAMRDLVQFHTEYKLQFMAYSQKGLRTLGRIVANPDALPAAEVFRRYATELGHLMALPVRPSSNRNVLQHAFGYVSGHLTAREKKHFLDLLDEYRLERIPLSGLLTLLQSWVLRFEVDYLWQQRFFEPYPRALLELSDSGAGR